MGEERRRDRVLRHLTDIQYERNDQNFVRGKFRVRGDVLEIYPVYEDLAMRIEFFGDEVERIVEIDPLTGEILGKRTRLDIYPAKHWVTTQDRLNRAIVDIEEELAMRLKELDGEGKLLEAARLQPAHQLRYRDAARDGHLFRHRKLLAPPRRTRSRASTPWTLLDYMPDDFLLVVDESHIALPQVRGMFNGDRARKQVLVDYGFRLPSALDNRPLTFDEFEHISTRRSSSRATPGPYEYEHSAAGGRADHSPDRSARPGDRASARPRARSTTCWRRSAQRTEKGSACW